jgi:hypothetical protein
MRIRILGSVRLANGSRSVPKSSVTFRVQKNQFFHIFNVLNEFKKLQACKNIKFYFATIISILSEKRRIRSRFRIRILIREIRMRIREAQKNTDPTVPGPDTEHGIKLEKGQIFPKNAVIFRYLPIKNLQEK